MKLKFVFLLIFILGCSARESEIQFPKKIGVNKIDSVIRGDSAVFEINTLHHLEVAAKRNVILKYGINLQDILYISQYANNSDAENELQKMISKIKEANQSPFGYIVPMKKYDNSYMTLGMGSVHYIYQSGNHLIWLSTKQKFYNELPPDLLAIFPASD